MISLNADCDWPEDEEETLCYSCMSLVLDRLNAIVDHLPKSADPVPVTITPWMTVFLKTKTGIAEREAIGVSRLCVILCVPVNSETWHVASEVYAHKENVPMV
jgi:hypothetical protein